MRERDVISVRVPLCVYGMYEYVCMHAYIHMYIDLYVHAVITVSDCVYPVRLLYNPELHAADLSLAVQEAFAEPTRVFSPLPSDLHLALPCSSPHTRP